MTKAVANFPLFRALALELFTFLIWGISSLRKRWTLALRRNPANRATYYLEPEWLRAVEARIVTERMALGTGVPTQLACWVVYALQAKAEKASRLFKTLPKDNTRLRPSTITQRRGDTKEWQYSDSWLDSVGSYVELVKNSNGLDMRLELRSVFRPGIVMAALDQAQFVRHEGSWRDYRDIYVGRVGDDEHSQMFWELDFSY